MKIVAWASSFDWNTQTWLIGKSIKSLEHNSHIYHSWSSGYAEATYPACISKSPRWLNTRKRQLLSFFLSILLALFLYAPKNTSSWSHMKIAYTTPSIMLFHTIFFWKKNEDCAFFSGNLFHSLSCISSLSNSNRIKTKWEI